MAKINFLTAYPLATTPLSGNSILIGSLASGGDTKNFLLSDISTFVLGNAVTPTLDDVCQQGASTTTGITVAGTATFNGAIDANSTADVSGAVTLGSTLGVTGAVTLSAGATINGSGLAVNGSGGILVTDAAGITSAGGPVSGTALNTSGGLLVSGTSILGEIDSAGPADIADTLTLSNPSGTGLNVTSNATIGGSLTVDSTAVFTDAGSSISAAGLISTAGNILALGDVGAGGTLGVVGITTLTGALDANSTADIADTLTLSKATGTGLQVTSNANILGNLTVDDISSQIGNPFTISAGGSLAATVNTFARYTFEYGITTTSGVSVLDGVRLVNTPPASSVASGIAGDLAVDATYIYVCVGANSWGRVAIDTTPF